MEGNNLNGKKIGTLGLVINGLAYLCPACIIMYYGVMNVNTGGSFPLAILVAGLVMLPTAQSYVKMSAKYPSGGSVFTYASKAMGYKIGFLIGWLLILDYMFLGITCCLTSGIYLNAAIPSLPAWAGIIATALIIVIVCYRGIKGATLLNSLCVIAPIVILVLLLIVYCGRIARGEPYTMGTFFSLKAFYNPEFFNMGGCITCVAILCMLFVGYDAVTTMTDQAINPEKTIPRAVWIICIYAILSFTIIAYIMNLAWEYTGPDMMQNPDTAMYEMNAMGGSKIGAAVNAFFVVLNTVACIGCTMTCVVAVSNIFRVMADAGFLPKKFFGYVHPKYQTASRNILLCGAIFCMAILFVGELMKLANLVSFGCLLSFAVTNVACFITYWIQEKKRGFKSVWSYIVLPLVAAAINLFLWSNLDSLAMIVGFSWLVIGFIILLIGTKGFKVKPELNL